MTVPNDAPAARRAAVYRLYSADGTLLYIGSSYDPDARFRVHREKWWGHEIARRAIKWCSSRASAFEEEAETILGESPKYNQYGKVEPPNSEAILRRNELNRLRERSLSEAAGVRLAAERAVESRGGSRVEAIEAGLLAQVDFLDQVGIHAKRVAELRAEINRRFAGELAAE